MIERLAYTPVSFPLSRRDQKGKAAQISGFARPRVLNDALELLKTP
jgi:hypothetical protein